jgi:hypothetical protein
MKSDKGIDAILETTTSLGKMLTWLGWFLIVCGVPLIAAFGMGIVIVICGVIVLRYAKKIQQRDFVEGQVDKLGAIVHTIKDRAQ